MGATQSTAGAQLVASEEQQGWLSVDTCEAHELDLYAGVSDAAKALNNFYTGNPKQGHAAEQVLPDAADTAVARNCSEQQQEPESRAQTIHAALPGLVDDIDHAMSTVEVSCARL